MKRHFDFSRYKEEYFMKISEVEKRIDASYNTIRKFIEENDKFYYTSGNVIHVTELGVNELEDRYGLRQGILDENMIEYYKNQVLYLREQLEENKRYNKLFFSQIESRNIEAEQNKIKITELEEKIHKQEIEKLEIKHMLELEKNKSIWKKIFRK